MAANIVAAREIMLNQNGTSNLSLLISEHGPWIVVRLD